MSENINLLRQRRKTPLPKNTLIVLRLVSIVLLFTTAFVSVALLFLQLRSPVGDLKKEEITVLSNASALAPKTAKFLFVIDRLNAMSDITQKRPRFDATLQTMQTLVPQNVSVVSLKIEKTSISMTVTSSSLASIDALITNFTDALQQKKRFNKLVLNGIAADPGSRQYSLSLEADVL